MSAMILFSGLILFLSVIILVTIIIVLLLKHFKKSKSVSNKDTVSICPKCGSQIIADTSFCTKCGAKIKNN